MFKTNISMFHVISFNAFWKFSWLGNLTWDFLVLNFGTGIFGGLLEALGNCSVLIFVPIQSSLSLEIQSIPPPSSPGTTVYLISQNVTFLEKELAIFLS